MARFEIWLALRYAVVSNLLFGWRKRNLAFKSYVGPTLRVNN
jgi:hypothetical protein